MAFFWEKETHYFDHVRVFVVFDNSVSRMAHLYPIVYSINEHKLFIITFNCDIFSVVEKNGQKNSRESFRKTGRFPGIV